jgi:hypothetical protein
MAELLLLMAEFTGRFALTRKRLVAYFALRVPDTKPTPRHVLLKTGELVDYSHMSISTSHVLKDS